MTDMLELLCKRQYQITNNSDQQHPTFPPRRLLSTANCSAFLAISSSEVTGKCTPTRQQPPPLPPAPAVKWPSNSASAPDISAAAWLASRHSSDWSSANCRRQRPNTSTTAARGCPTASDGSKPYSALEAPTMCRHSSRCVLLNE